jgi:hypothetical protein
MMAREGGRRIDRAEAERGNQRRGKGKLGGNSAHRDVPFAVTIQQHCLRNDRDTAWFTGCPMKIP